MFAFSTYAYVLVGELIFRRLCCWIVARAEPVAFVRSTKVLDIAAGVMRWQGTILY